jgi:hypothetical protein
MVYPASPAGLVLRSRLVERDWAIRDVYLQRFAVTALPRQLQTLPCVPEFAELNTQPLAMRRRAYHQARREFDISD